MRVFTQDENRYANEEAMKEFEENCMALEKQLCQEIGGYKVSEYVKKLYFFIYNIFHNTLPEFEVPFMYSLHTMFLL